MSSLLNPYIGFTGNAREAMEFYLTVFGGKLDMNTFKEFNLSKSPADDNKIMHAQLTTEGGMTLMGSDVPEGMPYDEGSRISITLSGDDEAELRSFWRKLTEGGNVTLPLEKSPWNDYFGMVTDRFGVQWMVNINGSTNPTNQ